jgi:PiT family inorganic phosphate transporter
MSRDNLIASFIMVAFALGFLSWGTDYVATNYTLFIVATLFGLFMAFNIGGNDVANSFGTSVGAKTLTIKQALVVAAIFELSGAVFAGGEVTKTIRKGIVSLEGFDFDAMLFVYVMMAALLSAGIWLLFASKRGLPVSTTHSIVGGVVGASIALGFSLTGNFNGSLEIVNWSKIGQIALSWVLSPLLGGLLSYGIFWFIKKNILDYNEKVQKELKELKVKKDAVKQDFESRLSTMGDKEKINELQSIVLDNENSEYQKSIKAIKKEEKNIDAYSALKKYVPIVATFGALIISGMLLFKGLKHLKISLSTLETFWILLLFGTVAYIASIAFVNVIKKTDIDKTTWRVFAWLQIFTACAFAFSHGANDIANAIGPFAAILDVLHTGEINSKAPVPMIAMLTFGMAMIAGLWILGKDVINTVGTRLAEIFPVSGFAAELGASAVILMATKLGIPVSSTHILIGAVLGIGILNKDANWKLMRPIAMAWVITIPASAVLAGVVFYILKSVTGM